MDVVEVRRATSHGEVCVGVFGFGLSPLAFKGEDAAHPENFFIQLISGSSIFKDVSSPLAISPTSTSS